MSREITLVQAAQRLGLPYQDTHRLVLTGRLKGEQKGGRWFVERADVERLINERDRQNAEA